MAIRRPLTTALTVLLLLLAAACAVAWVFSYWAQPTVAWTERQRLASVRLTRGVLFWSETRQPPGSLAEFGSPWGRRFLLVRPPWRIGTGPNLLTADWQFAGFTWRRRSPPLTYALTTVPCWAVVVPIAAAGLALSWHRRRLSAASARGVARGAATTCGRRRTAAPSAALWHRFPRRDVRGTPHLARVAKRVREKPRPHASDESTPPLD